MQSYQNWVDEKVEDFREIFEFVLLKSLKELVEKKPEAYGCALVLGEGVYALDPIVVSNDLSYLDQSLNTTSIKTRIEAKYIPDHWQSWDHEAFHPVRDYLQHLLIEFEYRFIKEFNFNEYTEEETYLINAVTDMYRKVLGDNRNQEPLSHFDFVLLYISDSESPIIQQSVQDLNRGDTLKEVSQLDI